MAEGEHPKRVHYSGKYPKTYAEKYKERNPEKYGAEIEKIREKGKTPAGMHIPIMPEEILAVLKIQPGECGLDATLGYGGHTEKMLARLQGRGHLYATDLDPVESEKTKHRLLALGYGEDILTIEHRNFAEIDEVAPGAKFDFVLADLGVSSMQIDNPERGFTFRENGPLDLRMDQESGVPACEIMKEMSRQDLAEIFAEYSDEPYADEIAAQIRHVQSKDGPIKTTFALRDAVEAALEKPLRGLSPEEKKEEIHKSTQRVFQALRIETNAEFDSLDTFLEKLPSCMNSGGRAAILTFHSGEDRRVKKAFKEGLKNGEFREISEDVTRAGRQECWNNPRAKSAKLRWAVKQ